MIKNISDWQQLRVYLQLQYICHHPISSKLIPVVIIYDHKGHLQKQMK